MPRRSNALLAELLHGQRNGDFIRPSAIERITCILPKNDGELQNTVIESLKNRLNVAEVDRNLYEEIHILLITGILSKTDDCQAFWKSDDVQQFLQQFLDRSLQSYLDGTNEFEDVAAIFRVYAAVERKCISYNDNAVVQQACQLVRVSDSNFIFDYLKLVFERRFTAEWASAITESILKADQPIERTIMRHKCATFLLRDPSLLSDEQSLALFEYAKAFTEWFSDWTIFTEVTDSTEDTYRVPDFPLKRDLPPFSNFITLIAELVHRKKVDPSLLHTEHWECVDNKNAIFIELIARGHHDLIETVMETCEKMTTLIHLKMALRGEELECYFVRGMPMMELQLTDLPAYFVNNITNLFDPVLETIYDKIKSHKIRLPHYCLDALLGRSERFRRTHLSTLALDALVEFNELAFNSNRVLRNCHSPAHGKMCEILAVFTVLVIHGHDASDMIHRITHLVEERGLCSHIRKAAFRFLTYIETPENIGRLIKKLFREAVPPPSGIRFETVRWLYRNLPQTERLCAEIIRKLLRRVILLDNDVQYLILFICRELITNRRNEALRNLLEDFLSKENKLRFFRMLCEILYENDNDRTEEKLEALRIEQLEKALEEMVLFRPENGRISEAIRQMPIPRQQSIPVFLSIRSPKFTFWPEFHQPVYG